LSNGVLPSVLIRLRNTQCGAAKVLTKDCRTTDDDDYDDDDDISPLSVTTGCPTRLIFIDEMTRSIVSTVKCRRLRWAEHVDWMEYNH
jgi:hypothetical protein